MTTILTIIHVAVCVFLVVIVLLQQGKGADLGAAFGGSSQTVFGSDGPLPLLNKVTTFSAVIFMLTSITLAYYSANATRGSVIETAPVAPPPVEKKVETAPTPVPLERASSSADKAAPAAEKAPATFPGEQAAPDSAPAPAAKKADQAAPNEAAGKDAPKVMDVKFDGTTGSGTDTSAAPVAAIEKTAPAEKESATKNNGGATSADGSKQ